MFLFGAGSSILPYIISIIAIWSGLWFGHAHLFSFLQSHSDKQEAKIERIGESILVEKDTYNFQGETNLEKAVTSKLTIPPLLTGIEIRCSQLLTPLLVQNQPGILQLRGPPVV